MQDGLDECWELPQKEFRLFLFWDHTLQHSWGYSYSWQAWGILWDARYRTRVCYVEKQLPRSAVAPAPTRGAGLGSGSEAVKVLGCHPLELSPPLSLLQDTEREAE